MLPLVDQISRSRLSCVVVFVECYCFFGYVPSSILICVLGAVSTGGDHPLCDSSLFVHVCFLMACSHQLCLGLLAPPWETTTRTGRSICAKGLAEGNAHWGGQLMQILDSPRLEYVACRMRRDQVAPNWFKSSLWFSTSLGWMLGGNPVLGAAFVLGCF